MGLRGPTPLPRIVRQAAPPRPCRACARRASTAKPLAHPAPAPAPSAPRSPPAAPPSAPPHAQAPPLAHSPLLGPDPAPDFFPREFHEQLKHHPKLKDNKFYQRLMDDREKLLKEAFGKGYWDDAKGKSRSRPTPQPTAHPSPRQIAPPMISVTGKTLNGATVDLASKFSAARASLVGFFSYEFGWGQVEKYSKPFLEAAAGDPAKQMIYVHFQDSRFRGLFQLMVLPFQRARVPSHLRDNYLLCLGRTKDERNSIGMTNDRLGYVNLVDSKGRIRWQAMGDPTERELESMLRLANEL
ncbi:ATP10 protein-domain-containing protein [Hyaloraphidium curvatum]|nr:ATP10 protein-domain-containing protein [Hyaloraphidium curvatum]